MTRQPRRPLRGERGSISLWAVAASGVMIILTGLAVDLGGQVHARQHATDVAAQAARTGGQQLHDPQAVRGQAARVDPGPAIRAARAYLNAAGDSGTVTVRNGTLITVTATETYHTVFLGIIGIDRLSVTGRGQARTIRVLDGNPR